MLRKSELKDAMDLEQDLGIPPSKGACFGARDPSRLRPAFKSRSQVPKKVAKAKIEKVVKEYLERMTQKKRVRTSTDYLIDCPQCDRMRAMECRGGIWQCLWRDCHYVLPSELSPPDQHELKQILQIKRQLDFLARWKHVFK